MSFEEHVIDYARPLIDLQHRLRQINDLSLDKKYAEACALLPECISDIRVLQAVYTIMAEKEKGIADGQKAKKNPVGV